MNPVSTEALNGGQHTHSAAAQVCFNSQQVKGNKSMSDVLTRSCEGSAPWVIEKYNVHVKTFQQTHVEKHQVDAAEVL